MEKINSSSVRTKSVDPLVPSLSDCIVSRRNARVVRNVNTSDCDPAGQLSQSLPSVSPSLKKCITRLHKKTKQNKEKQVETVVRDVLEDDLDLEAEIEKILLSAQERNSGSGQLSTECLQGTQLPGITRFQAYCFVLAGDYAIGDGMFFPLYSDLSRFCVKNKTFDAAKRTRGIIVNARQSCLDQLDRSYRRNLNQQKKAALRRKVEQALVREDVTLLSSKERRSRARAAERCEKLARQLQAAGFQGLFDRCRARVAVEHTFPGLDEFLSSLGKNYGNATMIIKLIALVFIAYKQFRDPDPLLLTGLIVALFPSFSVSMISMAITFGAYFAIKIHSMMKNFLSQHYPVTQLPVRGKSYMQALLNKRTGMGLTPWEDYLDHIDYCLHQCRMQMSDKSMILKSGFVYTVHYDSGKMERFNYDPVQFRLNMEQAVLEDFDEVSFDFVEDLSKTGLKTTRDPVPRKPRATRGVPSLNPEDWEFHGFGEGSGISDFLHIIASWLPGIPKVSLVDVSNFSRHFNNLATGVKNAKQLGQWIHDLLMSLVGWAYTSATGRPFVSMEDEKLIVRAEDYVRCAQALLLRTTPSQLSTSADAHQILDLYENGCDITATMTSRGLDSKAPQELMRVHTALAELALAATKLLKRGPMRTQPLWINLFGKPRMGKTFLLPYLLAYIYNATHQDKYTPDQRYERKEDNVYWDGYHDQWATTFDDLFQSKRQEVRAAQAQTMIFAVNDAHFPLHMADIKDKGTVSFNSELVVSTTNSAKWEELSLTDPSALFRRCLLDFEVTVKPDFAAEVGVKPEHRLHPGENLEKRHFEPYVFVARNTRCLDLMLTTLRNINGVAPVLENGFTFAQVVDVASHLVLSARAKASDTTRHLDNLPSLHTWTEKLRYARSFGMTPLARSCYVLDITQYQIATFERFSSTAASEQEIFAQVESYFGLGRDQNWLQKSYWYYVESSLTVNSRKFQPAVPTPAQSAAARMQAQAAWMQQHPILTFIAGIAVQFLIGTIIGLFMRFIVFPLITSLFGSIIKIFGFGLDEEPTFHTDHKEMDKYYRRLEREELEQSRIEGFLERDDDPAHQARVAKLSNWFDLHTDTMSDAIAMSVAHNLVRVEVHHPGGVNTGQFLFFEGTQAIACYHVAVFLEKPGATLFFNRQMRNGQPTAVYQIPSKDITIQRLDKNDLAVVTIRSATMPAFPNIKKHFLTQDTVDKTPIIEGINLFTRNQYDTLVQRSSPYATRSEKSYSFSKNGLDITFRPFEIKNIATSFGDSGGVYFVSNTRFPQKILGIHNAGIGVDPFQTGYGTYVTQELLAKFSQPNVPQVMYPDVFEPNLETKSIPNASVYMGTPRHPYFPPRNTKIRPSVLADKLPYKSSTGPARLKPFIAVDPTDSAKQVEIDPGKLAREKGPTVCSVALPQSVYDMAEQHAREYPPPSGNKWKLTFDEVVLGVPGITGLYGIDLTTSAGYPHSLKQKTRKDLIKIVGEGVNQSVIYDESFGAELKKLEADMRNNIFEVPVFLDCLKDERRPIAKVLAGKSRLFNVGPLALLMVAKKYCGLFDIAMQRSCTRNGPAIGINVFKEQWGAIHRNLARFLNAIDLDVEGLDIHLPYETAFVFEKAVVAWLDRHGLEYDQGDLNALRCICLSVVMHLHITSDAVYLRLMGNSSGHAVTANFNSLNMTALLGGAWSSVIDALHLPAKLKSYAAMCHFVAFTIYGDDSVITVSPQVSEWFNPLVIKKVFELLYGITLTSADKTSEVTKEFKKLEDCTFLKRSFRKVRGMSVAPLDASVIHDMVLWVTDGRRNLELSVQNARSAAMEWVAHGPEVYTQEVAHLNQALAKLGQSQDSRTFEQAWSDRIECAVLQTGKREITPKFDRERQRQVELCLLNLGFPGFREDNPELASHFENYLRENSGWRALEEVSTPANCPADKPKHRRIDDAPKYSRTLALVILTCVVCIFTADQLFVKTEVDKTHPESAPNVRDVEETTSLTQFSESAVKVDEVRSNVRSTRIPSMNPFPAQNMGPVISRKYNVGTFSWTTALASGQPLVQLTFPSALMTHSTSLADKLKTFEFIRAGVEIQIRANTTQFHYGSLLVTNIASNTRYLNDMWQASGCRPMLLSAAAQTAITFRMPWLNPKNFGNIDTLTGENGTLEIYVLNPLGVSSPAAPTTVNVSIFASFYDVELAGFISASDELSAQKRALMYPEPGWELHSGKESYMKSTNEVLTGVKEATHTVAGIIKEITQATGNAAPLLAMLDKPTTVQAAKPAQLSYASDIMSGKGLDMGRKIALDQEAIVDVDSSIMGPTPALHSISEIAQKPMLFQVGSFDSTKAPSSTITLWNVCPSMCTADGVPPNYTAYHMGYMAFASRFAQYWRGSIKYALYFFTSQFTSARIRISYLPKYSISTVVGEADAGDYVSSVVDIKGDTFYEFSIPFLSDLVYELVPALATGAAYINLPKIVITVVNSSVSADTSADATIEYAVFSAAGEDFQLARPVNFQPSALHGGSSVTTWQFSGQLHSLDDVFRKPFKGISTESFNYHEAHYTMAEPMDALSDFLHRYGITRVQHSIAGPFSLSVTPADGSSVTPDSLNYWSGIFRFWRGSIRYKILTDSPGATWMYAQYSDGTTYPGSNGQVTTWDEMSPILELEIPWYQPVPYAELTYGVLPAQVIGQVAVAAINGSTTYHSAVYRAGGDDFCLSHLIGVASYVYTGALLTSSIPCENKAADNSSTAEESFPFLPDCGPEFLFSFSPKRGLEVVKSSKLSLSTDVCKPS